MQPDRRLIDVAAPADWEAFVAHQPYAQFLQSWAWGEFRHQTGCPIRRFALADHEGRWRAAIQLEYRKRRFMGYWFAPRGPIFSHTLTAEGRRDAIRELTEALLQHPELRSHVLFWRMEPLSRLADPEGLVPLSFRRSPAQDPSSTLVLDLSRSEEDLLAAMHEKTRYNIRVAERHGVRTRLGSTPADTDAFLALMSETATRDHFVQRDLTYVRKTLEILRARGMAALRLAEIEGRIVVANMEIRYGDTVTYLYGASASADRKTMAPYALHWDAIRAAKQDGFTRYDLWGANPLSKAMFSYKSSWEGITRFKRGWGGERVDLVGTWDLPFNLFLYRLAFLKQFFRN